MTKVTRHILIILVAAIVQTAIAQSVCAQMPIVRITYDALFSDSFTTGQMAIVSDDSSHYDILVRRRGASSLLYTKPSLAIKLTNSIGGKQDASLLGMRTDNYWVLDAMSIDKARMRNRASMDLWLEMSHKPWYQDQEPNCINGYRGQMVDVYINDQHMGIYHLCERIDRKQLKLKKYNVSNGGIRGLLYKSESWEATHPFYYYIRPFPADTVDQWKGIAVNYPEMDEGDSITWQPLLQFMEYVRSTSYTNIQPTIQDYLDMPVYIDYVLFCDLLSARDNEGKNIYWSYYDKNISNKALVSLWDIDHSWGRQYNGEPEIYTRRYSDYIYRKLIQTSAFHDSLCCRYCDLRQRIFKVEHLDSIVGKYFDLYSATGMDSVERALWNGVDNIAIDIPAERAYMHNWLTHRLTFLDSIYGYKPYPSDDVTQTQARFTTEEKKRCQRLNVTDSTITVIFSPDRFDVLHDSLIYSVFAYGTITAWKAPVEEYKLSYFSADSCFYATFPFKMLERPGNEGQPSLYFRVYYGEDWRTDTLFIDVMPLDSGNVTVDPRLKLHDGGILLMWPEDDIEELGERVQQIAEKWPLSQWQLENNTEQQAEFANFRRVPGTKHLYRSFHPFYPIISDDTAEKRVYYAGLCGERIGIQSAICLSGDQTNKAGIVLPCGDSSFVVQIPAYYRQIADNHHILYVGQATDCYPNYQNTLWYLDKAQYGEWMAEIIHFVLDTTNYTPIQMHCSLGADRTGSFSAVIAALCGASWEDIAVDYEATSLTRDQLYRHRGLIRYTLTQLLGESPDKIDNLQLAMTNYLIGTGHVTPEEIVHFVERLNEEPTSISIDIQNSTSVQKIMHKGQFLIERNGEWYSIIGTKINENALKTQ